MQDTLHATLQIRQLPTLDAPATIAALTDLLVDCVQGGASISFMLPLPRARAEAFWCDLAPSIASGGRTLLVAHDESGAIVGAVQLVTAQPDNQPHRADVSKLLVHRNARRKGVAAALMAEVEQCAAAAGKTLLVLDTATGSDAERLYARLGWQRCGTIPDYALMPDGQLTATTVFYKRVNGAA